MIYIGSDHQGYILKEQIKKYLKTKKIRFEDIGVDSDQKKVDYPDYAIKVAEKVVAKKGARGILLCGSGIGMVVAANKVKGARAGQAHNQQVVRGGRHDDDMNILVLAAWDLDLPRAKQIVADFLRTKFGRARRYHQRLKKIERYEKKAFKL